MIKNREGYLVGKTKRQCTNCLCIFEITSKTVTMCPKCNTTRVKSQSIESKMYRRAKTRAKRRNIDFNIDQKDLIIPNICPILQIDLFVTTGKSGSFNNSPSLDRIDSTKGYIKGNIQIISSLANVMKSNASEKELITFAHWILKTYSNITLT